jgi:Rrf2 family protein
MKLSTKMRYGTRVMVELGMGYPKRAVSVKELAKNQRLSIKYLEHIMAALKGSGLIKPERGVHGGYSLVRDPNTIRLIELYRTFEGPFSLLDCIGNPNLCEMNEECPTRDTWVEMNEALEKILERTTIQDLLERKTKLKNSTLAMYHI